MYLKNVVFQIICRLALISLYSVFVEGVFECRNFDVQIRRFGFKAGFHRDLVTVIEWKGINGCSILLEESLPCGMYVDVDQLRTTTNHSTSKVLCKTKVNVEWPAHKASPQHLLIYPSDHSSRLRENHFQLMVKVPIHLRYHLPVPGKAFESISLTPPNVLMKCSDKIPERCQHRKVYAPCDETEREECQWIDITHEKAPKELIEFKVPIGMINHKLIVTMTTALSTIGATVWTIIVIRKSWTNEYYEDGNDQKG